MIGIFKQKTPANTALLFIFGLLIKLPLFLYPRPLQLQNDDGILFRFLFAPLALPEHALLCSVIAFVLLYIQALILTFAVNEYRLTTKPNFLPGMAYLLITSLMPEWNYLSAALVSSTLIIWSFSKLFRLYNLTAAKGTIYDIGLLTGISSMIYFPSVIFGICILFGILILRTFRINEVLLLLLGVATPYYFYSIYLFLNDRLQIDEIVPATYIQVPYPENIMWVIAVIILLGAPFIAGGYHVQSRLRKMLIQARKNWAILLFYAVISLGVPFINSNGSLQNWLVLAAPFAAFHASAYLSPQRKWVSTMLFYLTIAVIIVQQYWFGLWQ